MDDDPEAPGPSRASQLSKTPSWVMLGFVLGALAVFMLPRSEKTAAPPPAIVAPPPVAPAPATRPTVERAVFFEDVFAELNHLAVWQDELTEVAFWNPSRKAFSDCYEVLKAGDKFYFRSIPHLTRPVLTEGVPADSPLQFTVPGDAAAQNAKAFRAAWNFEIAPGKATPVPVPTVPTAAPPVEKITLEPPRPDGK